MLENQKLHNQLCCPSWIIDGFNVGRRPFKKYLGKLDFIPSSGSGEEYQGFPIFQQIRRYGNILNVQKGHRTPFLKWPPKEYHIQVWSNFNHSRNTSSNRRSTWEKLTDDERLMVVKAHMCLWLWWAKRNFWYNTEEYLIFVCLILPLYEHESEKKNSFLVRK